MKQLLEADREQIRRSTISWQAEREALLKEAKTAKLELQRATKDLEKTRKDNDQQNDQLSRIGGEA